VRLAKAWTLSEVCCRGGIRSYASVCLNGGVAWIPGVEMPQPNGSDGSADASRKGAAARLPLRQLVRKRDSTLSGRPPRKSLLNSRPSVSWHRRWRGQDMTFGRMGLGAFVVGRAISALLALVLAGSPAAASGTIGYGSRAGMEVTVTNIEGLDTSRAIIRTKHTRENAISFCRDYVQSVTEKCIQQEFSVPLNDLITANCSTGEFTDFYGNHYRFLGPNRKATNSSMAKYAIMNLMTNKIADGTMVQRIPYKYRDLPRAMSCACTA